MKPGILDHLAERGRSFTAHVDEPLVSLVSDADVLYVVSPMKIDRDAPRTDSARQLAHHHFSNFIVTPNVADTMPQHGIILDPFPPLIEMPLAMLEHPKVRCWTQIENGLWIWMSVLERIMNLQRSLA
jgi:aspartate carbamoyltransferase catalytic subunit